MGVGPTSPVDPVVALVSELAEMRRRIADLERAAQRPKLVTFTYNDVLNDGSAVDPTAFAVHGGLFPLTAPTRMVVTVYGWWGFPDVDHGARMQVWDEAGNNITQMAAAELYNDHPAGTARSLALLGVKDYPAGAATGFQLAYWVTTSNLYIRTGTKIDFVPL